MHCVNFFGTNDYAWIEEFNIKDYKEFKETFSKSKQSKGMTQAVEAMEKYLKTKDNDGGAGEAKEEFDSLVSEPAEKKTGKKGGVKKTESRKREANDSDSSASGPSSTSPSKRVKVTAKVKEAKESKKEEPSSSLGQDRDSPVPSYSVKKSSSSAVSGLLDRPAVARPASPSIGIDLVTSSQTLREKDIQPSKLNFGFLGLGIMG